MTDARINIIADDNQVDALVQAFTNLTNALVDSSQAMGRLEGQSEQLEGDLKDVEKASNETTRAIDALGVAAAGVAAAMAIVGAAVEGTKAAVEAFGETNEEAGARMDMLGQSAQTLLGSIGRVALGGDNFAQTLEVLTQMFERLDVFVQQNSESLSEMATSVLRILIQAFFGLVDAGLAVIRFITRLDENLLLLEATFLDVKAGVLSFADDALEGIGDFVAGAIDGFADLLSALDDVQTAIIDNQVIRTIFGIDEDTVITGPVGAIANGLRSAADSVREISRARFGDEIGQAARRAEALRQAVADTEDPIQGLRENMRVVRDDTLAMIDNLENISARPVEVNINQVSGGGGGGGGAGSPEPPLIDLEEQLRTSEDQLQALETLYEDNFARLLEIISTRRSDLQELAFVGDKGEIAPFMPNPILMALESEAVQEYLNWSAGVQRTREGILKIGRLILATEEDIELAQQRSAAAASRRQSGSALLQAIPSMMVEEAQDALRQLTDGYEEIHQEALRRTQYVVDTAGGMSGSGETDTYLEFLVDVYQEREQAAIAAERTLQQNLAAERQRQQARLAELEQSNQEQNYNEQLSRIQTFYSDAKNEIQAGYQEIRATVEERNAGIQAAYDQAIAEQEQALAELLSFRAGIQERLDELYTGFAMRGDRDERNALIDLEQQRFNSAQEGIDAITAALSRQEQKWIATNGGLAAYIDQVVASKEATREAFKTDAIDGFTSSIESIGSFLGQTLAQSFDDGLTGAERAKALLAGILGDFLTTIGSTAIAQGAIVAFGDPALGGLPNPGRAAGLIAAGTAAVIAGSALTGVASNIQRSGQGTAAAATPGATSSAQSTTNVFIENRFGNRFDARELDRSANETFSRAAQAGQ